MQTQYVPIKLEQDLRVNVQLATPGMELTASI